MNDNLKAFYVAVWNNEVVCFETNLSAFHKLFDQIEPGCRNYVYFNRAFAKARSFNENIDGKNYHFQKLV